MAEVDRAGKRHAISSTEAGEAPQAERVPLLQLVDDNSTIHVEVRGSVLAPETGTAVDTARVHEIAQRLESVLGAAAAVDGYLQARRTAITAYQTYLSSGSGPGTPSFRAFEVAKGSFGASEEQFTTSLIGLFKGQASLDVDAAAGKLAEDERPLLEFLDGQVRSVAEELRQVQKRAVQSGFTLRLEAIHEPRGDRERAAVHLEGYDAIDAGEVQLHDVAGLDLSPEEREALEDLARGNERVSDALDRMSRGQSSYSQVLQEVAPQTYGRLRQLAETADSLRNLLTPAALQVRLQRVNDARRGFVDEARQTLGALAKARVDSTLRRTEAGLAQALSRSEGWTQVTTVVLGFRELRRPQAGAKELTDWILSVRPTVRLIQKPGELVREVFKEVLSAAEKITEDWDALPDNIRSRTKILWDNSPMRRELEDLAEILGSLQSLVEQVEGALLLLGRAPALDPITVRGQLSVPIEDATDTALELARTPRLDGDRFTLRATLLRDETVVQRSTAAFSVQRFGWRGTLKPAVIVLTPDKFEDDSNRRVYSTGVSWLWRYLPRGDDNMFGGSFLSSFRPAFGPHAAFLNFSAGERQDIGFGLTISVLDAIVQVGAGWNPFARSDSDGRYYYFFGSDLFGVLQNLNLTRKGNESADDSKERVEAGAR